MADIDYDLDLNSAGFVAGSVAAVNAVDRLSASLSRVDKPMGLVQRGFDRITPKRSTLLGFGAATAAAAAQEQSLSGLAATQRVLAKDQDAANKAMRVSVRTMGDLARTYPVGNRGAQEIVTSLSRMGITGEDSQKKIRGLSKVFAELGASGESGVQVGQGVVQLARAMGDDRLNPTRIRKLSDAVVKTAAESGSAATDILGFSKAIAPLAKNAGIGETGVLGIASAFTKIGEDGTGAATAVNKMMSDLNHSVRDGTSELDTYADVVGKTRKEFLELYKSSPIEALTQVTEAVAKGGPGGQRILERLGIESIRGQRSLAALSNSGGLREQVATAAAAYGSGATKDAAGQAFGGLVDSFNKAEAAGEQLAVALGTPLLSSLSKFVDLLSKPLSGAAKVAQSDTGKNILMGATALASALIVPRLLKAAGTAASAVRIAGSNNITNAIRGGLQAGTGQPMTAAQQRRFGYTQQTFGAAERERERIRMAAPYVAAPTGAGIPRTYAGFGERAYAAAAQFSREREVRRAATSEARAAAAASRPGMGTIGRLGLAAWAGINRVNNQFNDIAGTKAGTPERDRAVKLKAAEGTPAAQLGKQINPFRADSAIREASGLAARMAIVTSSVGTFNTQLKETTGRFGTLGRVVSNIVSPYASAGRAVSSTFGGVAGIGRAAQAGYGSTIGRLGLGSMAITSGLMYAGMRAMGNKKKGAEEEERLGNMSITSTMDEYRSAMNIAGEATITLADQISQAGRAVMDTVTDFSRAREANNLDDRVYADDTKSQKIRDYGSNTTVEQVAARINSMGIRSAQEMQGVKIDLLRQRTPDETQDILNLVNDPPTTKQQKDKPLDPEQSRLAAEGAISMNNEGNLLTKIGRGLDTVLGGNGVDKRVTQSIDEQVGEVSQRFRDNRANFNEDYAKKVRFEDAEVKWRAAVESKDLRYIQETGDALSKMLTGKVIDVNELRAGPGGPGQDDTFIEALKYGKDDPDNKLANAAKQDYERTKAAENIPTTERSLVSRAVAGIGMSRTDLILDKLMDNRAPAREDRGNKALYDVTEGALVDNYEAQSKATKVMIDRTVDAGGSMEELAASTLKAAFAITEGNPARDAMLRANAEAQRRVNFATMGNSAPDRLLADIKITDEIAGMTPIGPQQKEAVDQAKEQQVAQRQQMMDMAKQQLNLLYQSHKSERRAREDNQRSVTQANYDFQVSMTRNEEAFERSRFRTRRNFAIQTERGEVEYQISRARGQRSFELQMRRQSADFALQELRGTEDFHQQRQRAQADFNKQMARMAEDGAKAMYDPYKRINVQSIWDGRSLVQNMIEQTEQMEQQAKNLARARDMGLSNQAIDILGLAKAENAQQLQVLLDNTSQDPKLIAALNSQTTKRQKAGETLAVDASDVNRKRAEEDFQLSLARQEKDFAKSMRRARDDFGKQMRRARDDFNLQMTQMETDHKRQLKNARKDLNLSLDDMATDQNIAVKQANTDHTLQMSRQAKNFRTTMERMRQDVADAQLEISGSFEDLQTRTLKELGISSKEWGKVMPAQLRTILGKLKELAPDFASAGEKLAKALVIGTSSRAQNSKSASRQGYGGASEFGGPAEGEAPSAAVGNLAASGGDFGVRRDPFTKRRAFHTGVDVPMAMGTPVMAKQGGRVVRAQSAGSYGNMVELDHGQGQRSRYAHLSAIDTRPGEVVNAGESLGKAGSSGRAVKAHLHYEELRNGKAVRPGRAAGPAMGGPLQALGGPEYSLKGLGLSKDASWAEIVDFVRDYSAMDGEWNVEGINWGNIRSEGWAQRNIVPASGGGVTIQGGINKNVKGNFTGFLNALMASGYKAKSVAGFAGVNRVIASSGSPSNHAYGAAVDIDPFALGNGFDYGPDSKIGTGHKGNSFMANLAHRWGLGWGGEWRNRKDWMHFEAANGPASPRYSGVATEPPGGAREHGGGASSGGGGAPSSNENLGRRMAGARGWGARQQDDLDWLWTHESGWNHKADNPSSTAYGIPQFLDATWRQYGGKSYDPAGQISKGMRYISDRYGSPSGARRFWENNHWYGEGGIFTEATQIGGGRGVGERGPEAVIPLNVRGIETLSKAFEKYMSLDEAKGLSSSASRTYITYNGPTSIDQGFHAEHVTVQAQDPGEMARKLQAQQRVSNLTGARRGR